MPSNYDSLNIDPSDVKQRRLLQRVVGPTHAEQAGRHPASLPLRLRMARAMCNGHAPDERRPTYLGIEVSDAGDVEALATDRVIPVAHGTTFDALRDVSPLLASRSGRRRPDLSVPGVKLKDDV